jgi:hypothetical protein
MGRAQRVQIPKLWRHGKILRRSLAMSGFVGLFPSKNQRRDENTSNGYARSLEKGCAALVVGWVVLIERTSIKPFAKIHTRQTI